ncbi:hypothetical protein BDZ91DRAFT_791198 [Kalaharituber pfeilii]|nr:hypothetical protein BDZ91DRAFT_791198 [Kalaharituber pfeilii]
MSHLTTHLSDDEVLRQSIFNWHSGSDMSEFEDTLYTSQSLYSERASEDLSYFTGRQLLRINGMPSMNTYNFNGHYTELPIDVNAGPIMQINSSAVDASTPLHAHSPTIAQIPNPNHFLNFRIIESWNLGQSAEAYDAIIRTDRQLVAPDIAFESSPMPAQNSSALVLPSSSPNKSETHIHIEDGIKQVNEAGERATSVREKPEKGKGIKRRRNQVGAGNSEIDSAGDEQDSISAKRAKMNNCKGSQPNSSSVAEEHQLTWIPHTPLVEYTFVPGPVPAEYCVKFAEVETVYMAAHIRPKRPKRARRNRTPKVQTQ